MMLPLSWIPGENQQKNNSHSLIEKEQTTTLRAFSECSLGFTWLSIEIHPPTPYQSNALVVITGDFNPNATGLCQKDITHSNNLTDLVSLNTRDANDTAILDWFLTNQRPSVSLDFPKWDHLTIMQFWLNQLSPGLKKLLSIRSKFVTPMIAHSVPLGAGLLKKSGKIC